MKKEQFKQSLDVFLAACPDFQNFENPGEWFANEELEYKENKRYIASNQPSNRNYLSSLFSGFHPDHSEISAIPATHDEMLLCNTSIAGQFLPAGRNTACRCGQCSRAFE